MQKIEVGGGAKGVAHGRIGLLRKKSVMAQSEKILAELMRIT